MKLIGRKHTGTSYMGYSLFFKGFLVLGMISVIGLFIFFNQYIVSGLRSDAARVSEAYARLIQYGASEATDPAIIDFIFENIITKVNFPIVVTDPKGNPVAWTKDIDQSKLKMLIEEFDSQNSPISISSGNAVISILHYGDSNLITKLQLIPLIEIPVVGLFILIAFIGFRHIQQSEQRSIWVGMAKETAHQLGTPLSSLIGWVELLKIKYEEGRIKIVGTGPETDFNGITLKMLADLKRLDRIATRFGQIGSIPELADGDINIVVKDVIEYFKVRIPAKGISIMEKYGNIPPVKVNTELISWVIENLVKNAMEATNPETGIITIKTDYNIGHKMAVISVEDNGRGVPSSEQKKIFAPGFTTKKRGWGLGLTLARRIVEEYHKGKISLKYSDSNIRTAFEIELPV